MFVFFNTKIVKFSWNRSFEIAVQWSVFGNTWFLLYIAKVGFLGAQHEVIVRKRYLSLGKSCLKFLCQKTLINVTKLRLLATYAI